MDFRKSFLVLLVACLLARTTFFFIVRPWDPVVKDKRILQSDPGGYHKLALTLLKHHRFAYSKDAPPEAERTPLYPLFIGFFYFLFGAKPWIIIFVQILIDTGSCLLLFSIISRQINLRVAQVASAFYALDPFFIFYVNTLMSEIVFIFLCVVGLYFFSEAIRNEFSRKVTLSLMYSALFFGLATLTRPITLFLPVVVGLFFLIFLQKRLKRAFTLSFLFAFSFLLILSPWYVRNYIVFKKLSFSTAGSYNFLLNHVAHYEMERSGRDYWTVRHSLIEEAEELMRLDGLSPQELNDFEKEKYWRKVSFIYIKKDPLLFANNIIRGLALSLTNLGTRGYSEMINPKEEIRKFEMKAYNSLSRLIRQWLQQKTRTEIILGLSIAGFLILSYFPLGIGILVTVKTAKGAERAFLFFCLLMILYFIPTSLAAGGVRYKLPVIPFYISFIGLGIIYLIENIKDRLDYLPQTEKSKFTQ